MTTPSADSLDAPATAKPTSRWEDFIDIFYTPTTVYERRQSQSPWPTIWIITIALTIITVLTFNSVGPLIESEMRGEMAKQMAKNAQMTQDNVDMGIRIQMFVRRWMGLFTPLGVLLVALFVWIVAKIVGAKETYGGALIAVTYASIIGLVAALILGAQALVLDVSNMTSPDQLSLSAARFADKATTSPALYALLKALDVFGIWSLVVMAIGVRVTGKTSRNQAMAFAAIWFVLTVGIAAAFAARAAAAAG